MCVLLRVLGTEHTAGSKTTTLWPCLPLNFDEIILPSVPCTASASPHLIRQCKLTHPAVPVPGWSLCILCEQRCHAPHGAAVSGPHKHNYVISNVISKYNMYWSTCTSMLTLISAILLMSATRFSLVRTVHSSKVTRRIDLRYVRVF